MHSAALTREQLAVFMRAFSEYLEYGEVSAGRDENQPDDTYLGRFIDAGEAGDWATDSLAWAVERGLLSGTGEGLISPKMTATRSQICVIVMNYMQDLSNREKTQSEND